MARQSRLPTVLLTRPAGQGDRFADALRDRIAGGLTIVTSPLMVPAFLDPAIPDGPFEGLIFTSATGVEAAVRLARPWPDVAWCVGDRTAIAARTAGFQARSAQGDAPALVRAIVAARQPGPLLHLRGRHSRGDVAATLTAAGIQTRACVVYDQRARPLTEAAVALLGGAGPVVAPVFSPRTAALLSAERTRLNLTAPLRLVAMSAAVAADFAQGPDDDVLVASLPDAAAMLKAVAKALGTA